MGGFKTENSMLSQIKLVALRNIGTRANADSNLHRYPGANSRLIKKEDKPEKAF